MWGVIVLRALRVSESGSVGFVERGSQTCCQFPFGTHLLLASSCRRAWGEARDPCFLQRVVMLSKEMTERAFGITQTQLQTRSCPGEMQCQSGHG